MGKILSFNRCCDKLLNNYRDELSLRHTDLIIPFFCKTASHKSEVLLVLQDPGNSKTGSDAMKTMEVSSFNNDGSARRTNANISRVGLEFNNVLCWNYYAAFRIDNKKNKNIEKIWGEELHQLIKLLPNLKVILALGNEAKQGIEKYVKPLLDYIEVIYGPHPSNQSINTSKKRKLDLEVRWSEVADLVLNKRSIAGKVLDNIQSRWDVSIKPNVTGRDAQIAREALLMAIPVALRHSLSYSNTFDMMRLLKSLGGGIPIPDFRSNEDHVLKQVISELRNGKKAKANLNPDKPDKPHPMQDLIDEYLLHPEIYMPEKGRF